MNRKWILIPSICLLAVISLVACAAFWDWINEPMNPIVPQESSPGKLILTSRGCCFWATDAVVSFIDASGKETVLISEKTV